MLFKRFSNTKEGNNMFGDPTNTLKMIIWKYFAYDHLIIKKKMHS